MEGQGAEILDAEPGEGKLLIHLIETLIQDWYVAREARLKRLEGIRQIVNGSSAAAGSGE
jgi:hypothetical protein